jgi:hypothetical protein
MHFDSPYNQARLNSGYYRSAQLLLHVNHCWTMEPALLLT